MYNDPPPMEYVRKTLDHGNGKNTVMKNLEPVNRPAHGDEGTSHVPIHYSSTTARNVILFVILVAVALGVIFVLGHHSRARAQMELSNITLHEVEQPVPVDVVHVERAPAAAFLGLPGRTSAWFETTLYARVSGYVHDFNKDIGDHVKANEVLATIETPELDDQYTATLARIQELQAERNVADSAVHFTELSYKRWQAAVPAGVVAIQERDQKKSEWDEAIAKLKAADAQITSGEADLARLKHLQEFKSVEAPFDGVITARQVDKGSLVTAGSTTNTTPLFTIAKYDTVRVFVDVPEAAAPDIHNGMEVSVKAREYPGRDFSGKVARTSEAIDPATKTLKVEVDVPNPKLELLPGMFVMSTFRTSRAHPPLRVPAAGLTFGPSGAEVAVIGPDNRVQLMPVTIGRDLGNEVEIASGLTGNETIALNVGSQIASGDKVDPHDIDETAAPQPTGAHAQPSTASAVIPGNTK